MQLFIDAISLTFGALLPIMNPFSTAPLFVSLTANFDARKRHGQAIKACLYAFAILVAFLLAGAIVDFGISIAGMLPPAASHPGDRLPHVVSRRQAAGETPKTRRRRGCGCRLQSLGHAEPGGTRFNRRGHERRRPDSQHEA